MRSSSGTRLYKVEIISGDDAGASVEFRALAIKDKEVVISSVDFGNSDNPINQLIKTAADSGNSPIVREGVTLTEDSIIGYFESVSEGVFKITDVFNSEVILGDSEGSGSGGGLGA